MNQLVMTVALALGGVGQPADAGARLDGKWLIVYAEEGGRRNNAWEQRQATVSGGTLSYDEGGGKRRTLRLKLGPKQTLEATGDEGGDVKGAWHGVYVLGQDYLSISLLKGDSGAAGGKGHGSSGDFILILRRQRGG